MNDESRTIHEQVRDLTDVCVELAEGQKLLAARLEQAVAAIKELAAAVNEDEDKYGLFDDPEGDG